MGRRILLALGIVVAIVLAGYVTYRFLFADPGAGGPAPSTSASAQAPDAGQRERIVLKEVTGKVESRSPGGKWRVLKVGDELNPNDQVRTGEGASAQIDLGEAVSVMVADRTELNVAELSSTLSRVRLDDGRIVSKVRGSKGYRFRVQVKGSDAVAESADGKFAVLRRGQGAVTVAAKEGSVRVSAQDKAVRVEAGEQSVVALGAPPAPPTKIPTSLLLKLGKPPPSRMRKREATVSGETAPGAVVNINGVLDTVGPDGRFTRTVALREGSNEIVVVVEDAVGRRKQAALPKITVDSRAPRVKGKVEW